MLQDVKNFITSNLSNERWVPYHTVLGVHEFFVVKEVHTRTNWSEKERFIAMFLFRAHCKANLFLDAELPIMNQKTFWKDPREAFRAGGVMEKAILKYRK